MKDASDRKGWRKTINQIIIYACIVLSAAFCHSMFMMAKFSLLFSGFRPFSMQSTFSLWHNHISVICDWWLDIKKSGGRSKNSKKNLFLCISKKDSKYQREKVFSFHSSFLPQSKIILWSFSQLFHFPRRKMIEKRSERAKLLFLSDGFKWIMNKKHCSVSLIFMTGTFREAFTGTDWNNFLYALDMIMPFAFTQKIILGLAQQFFLLLCGMSFKESLRRK